MKRDELKQTLKPLIKQCIKEVIFDDGVLSGIITEIVKGLGPQMLLTEPVAHTPVEDAPRERNAALEEIRRDHRRELEGQRKSLSESMGQRFNGIDVFEGVNPINKAGQPSRGPAAPSSALDGVAPNDPGVDISKLGVFGKGR
jgi:hypothetical protein